MATLEEPLPTGAGVLPPASARSILLTIVGELLGDGAEAAWTTALLRVLAGFGIEDHAARQLLSRSAGAGWLERERLGKAVRWRLAPHGRELVDEGVRRSSAYLRHEPRWDGRWLALFITVPQEQRTTRKRLYGGLNWLGLGNPFPGLWITPHSERAPELARLVDALGLGGTALSLVGHSADIGVSTDELVARSWQLDDLAARYRRFLDEESRASEPSGPDELLLDYLGLLNLQQRFMRLDPQLPPELLPDWIGRDASAHFRDRRRQWGTSAHRRWREVVRASAPS